MRASVIRVDGGRKVLRCENVPDPNCGPCDVLVRVSRVGICGSDLHGYLDAEGTARREGLIMGHEIAGEIAGVGDEVTAFAVGDRVTVDPQVVCGECGPCRDGWISICDHKRVTGSSLRGFEQGGMAEHLVVRASQAHPVPEGLNDSEAALIEPLANALHAVGRAREVKGSTAVVLGAGPLGLCMVQALRARGAATVVVTDLSDDRLDVARAVGADLALNSLTSDVGEQITSLTSGVGADVVVESVGVDATYRQALALVRKRGQVMFFGAAQDTVSLPLLAILHKEVELIGCTGANDETSTAISLVESGDVVLGPLLTHSFPLERADEAMDVLADRGSGAIKVQVVP